MRHVCMNEGFFTEIYLALNSYVLFNFKFISATAPDTPAVSSDTGL